MLSQVPSLFVVSTTTAHRFPAMRPRPLALVDVTIAVAALVGSLAQLAHGGIGPSRTGPVLNATHPGSEYLDAIGVVLAGCSTLPLLAWRRSPSAVFVVTAAASVLLAGLGYPLDLMLGAAAALYVLATSRGPDMPWTRWTTVTVLGLFVAYLVPAAIAQQAFPVDGLVHSGLAWAVAWFAGERTRLRRDRIVDLRDRAHRAEHEAERERRLAVAEERARIARDLHDSAGHAISVIAVQAGAARLRHHNGTDRSLVALEAIEELARETATQIDHIVGALRDGAPSDGTVEPPLGLGSLDTLVERHTEAGLELTVDAAFSPGALDRAADHAAYRILQEALTNAARHGTGCAHVELHCGDTAIELAVTNPAPAGGVSRSGGGHGLIGMREHAVLLGGDLEVERRNGTFRLRARIPYRGLRS